MWSEEAVDLVTAGRSLTELAGIGPTLAKRLHGWFDAPPAFESPPVRREFLTLAQARKVLAKNPQWRARLNGDLQMHTKWSDGGGTISEMAAAAIERGYKFIAITDHTKGLKIAGGLDEESLERQGREIAILNKQLRTQGIDFTILRRNEPLAHRRRRHANLSAAEARPCARLFSFRLAQSGSKWCHRSYVLRREAATRWVRYATYSR
jgi:hypothetical protein